MPVLDSDSIVRFATFEVDLRNGELRKGGLRIRLQEQPFQVLAALLRCSGEVVTREELRESVWPEDTFVDFDHALNTAIKKIRAALGDDADNPRFLETVPRRGYRFIAPVERELAAPAPPVLTEKPEERRDPYRLLTIVGVIAIGLALLGLAWKVVPWHRSTSPYSPPEYQRLSFGDSDVEDARFTPDGATVVFSGTSAPYKYRIFTHRLDGTDSQVLGVEGRLLAASRDGELAIQRGGEPSLLPHLYDNAAHVLAQMPLGGGAPRDLLTGVEAADWSPDNQLAIVRQDKGKIRLEFPVGKVLYETSGWIASPRFSPRGDLIAFLDHPVFPDDRGSVAVVDLAGKKRTISGFWESARGLAWSPNGEEVWFAATRSGVGRALNAVTLSGQERRVLSVAGGLTLHDISHDGRVLLTQDNQRLGILFMGAGEKDARELSWLNWSMAAAISPDGKKLLFGEEGENSGPSYQVGLRPTDNSPAVILGQGVAQSLSPDGKWALSIMPPPNDQIVLLPTGAGNAKALDRGPIEHYRFERAKFLPDEKHIVFGANEPDHGQRCYVQDVDGGKPRAITPEGIAFCSVAPDGKVLAVADDFRGFLYDSTAIGSKYREIKLNPGEVPVGWTADAKFIYVVERSRPSLAIARFELATGKREMWKELAPPPLYAKVKDDDIVITPDGQTYAYTYHFCLSDLYLVRGLK